MVGVSRLGTTSEHEELITEWRVHICRNMGIRRVLTQPGIGARRGVHKEAQVALQSIGIVPRDAGQLAPHAPRARLCVPEDGAVPGRRDRAPRAGRAGRGMGIFGKMLLGDVSAEAAVGAYLGGLAEVDGRGEGVAEGRVLAGEDVCGCY